MKYVYATISYLLVSTMYLNANGEEGSWCFGAYEFEGNARTHKSVLERELTFHAGQCFADSNMVMDAVDQSIRNLVNTSLFQEVIPDVQWLNQQATIKFEIRERWYIFPEPVFELSDRNFNEWWNDYNADFSRITYGFRITDYNFRGRAEQLRLRFESGFSHYYRLTYTVPGMGDERNWGMEISTILENQKDLPVYSEHNKLQYMSSRDFLYRRAGGHFAILYRPGFDLYHRLEAGFTYHEVDSRVLEVNPDYFYIDHDGAFRRIFHLTYGIDFDKRNNSAYPTSGYRLKGTTELQSNTRNPVPHLRFAPETEWYTPLGFNFFGAAGLRGAVNFPDKLPWFHRETFGYSRNLVRGYERFVMEGFASVLAKVEIKNKVFSHVFNLERIIPFRQFQVLPIDLYPKVHADAGYIRNNNFDQWENKFNNKALIGYGFGLDLVTAYDKALRFEYTFMHDGPSGLFINMKRGI